MARTIQSATSGHSMGVQMPVPSSRFRVSGLVQDTGDGMRDTSGLSGCRFSVIGFVLLVLLFGCLQPYSGPAANKTVVPNKTEVTVPKTENITPPAAPQTNATQNITPKKNETTEPEVTKPKTPEIPKTNLSVGGIMVKELEDMKSPDGGPYSVVTYQWVSTELEADPTAIAINPTMDILFDKKSEKNLTGFAFKVYTPTEGGTAFAKGLAVVVNSSSLLEGAYTSGSSMDIDFNVPGLGKKLHGVEFESKKALINDKGKLMIVYGFDAQSAE